MALTIAPNLSQLMAEFHSSEDCVPLMRNSTLSDQPWEHPNDESTIDAQGECDFTFKGHMVMEIVVMNLHLVGEQLQIVKEI